MVSDPIAQLAVTLLSANFRLEPESIIYITYIKKLLQKMYISRLRALEAGDFVCIQQKYIYIYIQSDNTNLSGLFGH